MTTKSTTTPVAPGDELKQARAANRALLWAVFLFSMFTNALMLTGPLFMLQVYDRVLGSRSEETLLALSILVTFLFLMMGLLDYARGRVAARIGARFQDGLDERVFRATLARAGRTGQQQTGLMDLEAIQRLLSSPVFLAVFDLPWTPLFLLAIFIFHPWLGWLALAGGVMLVLITVLNQLRSSGPLAEANTAALKADRMAGRLQSESELVRSLGMQGRALARWRVLRGEALGQGIAASDTVGGFSTLTKTLRLFLQSAILGLGAYLVLQNELTAGAMIAASILMGRALAPVELAIGQWQLVARAREGWQRCRASGRVKDPTRSACRCRARALLEVNQLAVVPPGHDQPTLRGSRSRCSRAGGRGDRPSGAGKSTLAKALTGVWKPGAADPARWRDLDQYDPDILGQSDGLPAAKRHPVRRHAGGKHRRWRPPDPERWSRPAKRPMPMRLIRRQSQGYDTPMSAGANRLSGGQITTHRAGAGALRRPGAAGAG